MNYLRKLLYTSLVMIPAAVGLMTQAATDRMTHYQVSDGLSSPLVGGGVQDSNGLLWFATWNGLNCYDGYEFHRVGIGPADHVSIGSNRIRDIMLSDEGNIICHTDYGVYEFDLATYAFRDIPPERADSLLPLLGKPWRGLTDHQGNRWTGGRAGLHKTFSPTYPARILAGTEGENPRALLVDRDSMLWVGTRGHNGVSVYDRDGRQVRRIGLDSAPYCMFQSKDGTVWIGCKPGALYRDNGTLVSNDVVYDIAEDCRGRLWIATFGEGLKYCADPKSDSPVFSSSLGGGKVRKLYITPDGLLVAATDDGVLTCDTDVDDPADISLSRIGHDGGNPDGLSGNAAMSVGGDGKGNVCICTESSGLDMVGETALRAGHAVFRHFNKENASLGDDVFRGMTVMSDSLVILVCADHITTFNPADDTTVRLNKAFWGDSCDFNETTPVRIAGGRWAFGAREGVYVADVRDLSRKKEIPPLIFTTLGINGGSGRLCLPPHDDITLKAGERNITVGYAALDYIDNTDILYRTRLDGLPWSGATGSRSVTLFGLSPGRHVLEVQSTDRYGRWVDNIRTLGIDVEPYWYETWWAMTIFVMLSLAVAGAVLYTYLYIKGVKRRGRELLEKYMELINRDSESAAPQADNRPADPGPLVPDQKPEDTAFLNRVRRYVEDNLDNPGANIDEMAEASATSRSTLNRRLRSLLGVTAAQLLIEARMQKATRLLESQADSTVGDIAVQCGYNDVYYFQRVFKKKYGLSPADYRASRLA